MAATEGLSSPILVRGPSFGLNPLLSVPSPALCLGGCSIPLCVSRTSCWWFVIRSSTKTDVKDIGYVINYDFPNNCEDYIHRIGRTGRAGAKGTSYTYFTAENSKAAKELVSILRESKSEV